MEEDLIFKKATLALGGGIKLPEGFEIPVRVSHSTSGPGARASPTIEGSSNSMRGMTEASISRIKGNRSSTR